MAGDVKTNLSAPILCTHISYILCMDMSYKAFIRSRVSCQMGPQKLGAHALTCLGVDLGVGRKRVVHLAAICHAPQRLD